MICFQLYLKIIYPIYKNNRETNISNIFSVLAKDFISIDTIDLIIIIMLNKPIIVNIIPTIFNSLFFNSNY
jgi:hypothetical protein